MKQLSSKVQAAQEEIAAIRVAYNEAAQNLLDANKVHEKLVGKELLALYPEGSEKKFTTDDLRLICCYFFSHTVAHYMIERWVKSLGPHLSHHGCEQMPGKFNDGGDIIEGSEPPYWYPGIMIALPKGQKVGHVDRGIRKAVKVIYLPEVRFHILEETCAEYGGYNMIVYPQVDSSMYAKIIKTAYGNNAVQFEGSLTKALEYIAHNLYYSTGE